MKFEYQPNSPLDLFMEDVEKEKKVILTGNQAFVRGIYESGTQFLANYPGTPTSEIGDFWKLFVETRVASIKGNENQKYFYDLSVNEIVAFEAAVGASWSGLRSIVVFKHLGMNLISDALHSVMYSGIDGSRKSGLVILCGGDPNIKSSTNAQDIRLFSLHSKLPILTPSNIQECKDFVPLAFQLSEKWGLPVMIYTPTELNHSSGIVQYDRRLETIKMKEYLPKFVKDFDRYLNAIHWAKNNQIRLNKKINDILESNSTDLIEEDILNKDTLTLIGDNAEEVPIKVLIVADGICWTYLNDIFRKIEKKLPKFRSKLCYPFQRDPLIEAIKSINPELIIILEEQEKFIELMVKDILYDEDINIPIVGKKDIPLVGGLSPDIIIDSLSQLNLKEFKQQKSINLIELQSNLPIREPTFCPGCSHRNVVYSLKKATDEYFKNTGIEAIFGGDIGCYTLSMSEPYSTMDWLICMGAGVGIANGVGQVIDKEKQHLVALIGDSTFFHTGIQPIINLAKNNTNALVLILDNYYSSMTGHQLSPSTPTGKKEPHGEPIRVEHIVRSLGDFPLAYFDGYNLPKMKNGFISMFKKPGLKFIIVKAECRLIISRERKVERKLFNAEMPNESFPEIKYNISDHCTKCNECFETLGCTAIQMMNDQYYIDESRCLGERCGSCFYVCPNNAIYKTEINPHFEGKTKQKGDI